MSTKAQETIYSFVHAAFDAARAWAIFPTRYAHVTAKGRRPFTLRERLRVKRQAAAAIFGNSIRIRRAPTVVVRRMGTEGLIANLLHVIEVVHRVRSDASVYVDWKLVGDELGFRYGAVGSDVWSGLFRPIGTSSWPEAFQADHPVDYALWGTGKDYLNGNPLQAQRDAYHRTIAKWIEISNQTVLARTHRIYAEFFEGRFCIGVHRRVGNAGVANLQKDGKVPSLDTLLTHCNRLLGSAGNSPAMVFLATDDADAVGVFKKAFGDRLIVQDNIKRTTATKAEVHFSDWGRLSLSDAEDILVDTLLLARCNVLVHASSSVSTMASLLNPSLILVRAYETRDN